MWPSTHACPNTCSVRRACQKRPGLALRAKYTTCCGKPEVCGRSVDHHARRVGTKARNIRRVEGDHDIDCKVHGMEAMPLKSGLVRKA
ncbi:MAG: PhnA domain-containing protein [Hydrogenophaga sp.]|nr:PhnA domain-containing protein [Hydrogenophaga sp.]